MLPMDQRLNLLELEVQQLRAHQNHASQMAMVPHFQPPVMMSPRFQMPMQMPMPMHMPMPPPSMPPPTHRPPPTQLTNAHLPSPGPPQKLVKSEPEKSEAEKEEEDFKELQLLHQELVEAHKTLKNEHAHLLKAHEDLLVAMRTAAHANGAKETKRHPSLGVVRLDYDYPPAPGDSDFPGSFGYDVYYRCVPGLTFEMCQSGQFTELVERRFADAIKHLEARGAYAITGDCGFMMAFQVLARKIAKKPIFMSSMVQCPIIAASLDPDDDILILTANGESLKPQKEILLSSCGFDVSKDRFHIHGCQDVPGFDAVALGQKVPLEKVQPGIIKLVKDILQQKPEIRAILLECTELPPYADALRYYTGLPVWDAITAADFYVTAYRDAPRFGLQDWQREWDGIHEVYELGDNLTKDEQALLINKALKSQEKKVTTLANSQEIEKIQMIQKKVRRQQAPILGVIRLDYNYPPAQGDIDCPGTYNYDVLFRVVPGFTFAMAQSGKLTPDVEQEFIDAVKWLEKRGFMMAFQPLASSIASVPVFMSSMMQCPMISVAFDKYDKVMIMTANDETLKPQKEILLKQCGFNVDDDRFMIVGCQNVPGFNAVAEGKKVDVEYVTPGIVYLVKEHLKHHSSVRAILLECTELPPYADALRDETGLPVFDAITNADFFISSRRDNPRFGFNQWQLGWDGLQDGYEFGSNLDSKHARKLIS